MSVYDQMNADAAYDSEKIGGPHDQPLVTMPTRLARQKFVQSHGPIVYEFSNSQQVRIIGGPDAGRIGEILHPMPEHGYFRVQFLPEYEPHLTAPEYAVFHTTVLRAVAPQDCKLFTVYCSSCGGAFTRDRRAGYSHCCDHRGKGNVD